MKNIQSLIAIFVLSSIFFSCDKKGGDLTLFPVKIGDEYQYIDKEGKIIINPQFSEASVFRNGIALVRTTGDKPKWGYIDETGHYIINAQYKNATIFSEDLAWVVSEDESPNAINKEGKIIFSLQSAEEVRIFKGGFAAYRIMGKDGKNMWGFVNRNGAVIINPQFEKVGYFEDGLCPVSNGSDKWGYIDESGKIVINYQFSSAGIFTAGSAIVSLNKKFGAIDKTGKYLINPQFDFMWKDGESYIINQDEKCGWCDASGKIFINPQFKNAQAFLDKDIAPVQTGESWGYVDKTGKIIINPQFDVAFPFNGKFGLVSSSEKFGFIDIDGKYVINPQYDDVSTDFVYYLFGFTMYESVLTDYFNVDAVVRNLNLTAPEGLSLNTTFGSILKRFNLTESSFSEYSYQHTIFSNKSISSDISYSFYAYGNAFRSIAVNHNNGWYSYETNENRFAANNNIQGFVYTISLTGKGNGKAKKLVSSLVNNLIGFQRGNTNQGVMYFNKTIKIFFTGHGSEITILIVRPDGSETVDSNKTIDWDEVDAVNNSNYDDSTVVVEEVPVDDSAILAE